MTGGWVPHDTRDCVVDYVRTWSEKTELSQARLIAWIGVARSKFFDWQKRYGRVNEHNRWLPRDHWLTDQEKQAILDFQRHYPLEGYRRLTFMMLDRDLVAVSPASVYRVLKKAGFLGRGGTPSRKGTGFVQPLGAHEHWHVDVSYINIKGTFYFLCSVLDGCSRSIVHWDLREWMLEADVEAILQRAREVASRRHAADHLRQRTTVHRPRFQNVHPVVWHDPRPHLAVLSPEQRQNRTLAQDPQSRVHPPENAVVTG